MTFFNNTIIKALRDYGRSETRIIPRLGDEVFKTPLIINRPLYDHAWSSETWGHPSRGLFGSLLVIVVRNKVMMYTRIDIYSVRLRSTRDYELESTTRVCDQGL